MTTRNESNVQLFDHFQDTVMEWEHDDHVRSALKNAGIDSLAKLSGLDYNQVPFLTYPVISAPAEDGTRTSTQETLSMRERVLLRVAVAFVIYEEASTPGGSEPGSYNWLSVDGDDFDAFRMGGGYSAPISFETWMVGCANEHARKCFVDRFGYARSSRT